MAQDIETGKAGVEVTIEDLVEGHRSFVKKRLDQVTEALERLQAPFQVTRTAEGKLDAPLMIDARFAFGIHYIKEKALKRELGMSMAPELNDRKEQAEEARKRAIIEEIFGKSV